jgi:E3 ubiquitin-protein ligase synoviolin
MKKLTLYCVASIAMAAFVIYRAVEKKKQFYPTVVHIATSKPSMAVIGNVVLAISILFAHVMKRVFLGTLRDAEVEVPLPFSRCPSCSAESL